MYISNDIVGLIVLVVVGFLLVKGWQFYVQEHAKSVSKTYSIPIALSKRNNFVGEVYYNGFSHRWNFTFLGEPGMKDAWDDLSDDEIKSVHDQVEQALRKIDSRFGRN